MWQKEDDDTKRTWESAITYCEGLSLGSYTDWRLPNIKELEKGKRVKKEEGIYFDSIDTIRSILTNNRLLILKTIREQNPNSIYELAKLLRRDLKNVNQDLKLLYDIGLVTLEKLEEDKKRVIPHVEYSKILL